MLDGTLIHIDRIAADRLYFSARIGGTAIASPQGLVDRYAVRIIYGISRAQSRYYGGSGKLGVVRLRNGNLESGHPK